LFSFLYFSSGKFSDQVSNKTLNISYYSAPPPPPPLVPPPIVSPSIAPPPATPQVLIDFINSLIAQGLLPANFAFP
jgi:hypothetical protein